MSSVDVIVPCYGYAKYLEECVQSVLEQSDVEVRVLIIDDASPDNCHEVASALEATDPRVSVITHAQNQGHIRTYNEGIAWASADYMLLLSADDYLLPGALSRAVALMECHPHVGMVYGRAIEFFDFGEGGGRPEFPASSSRSAILHGAAFVEISGVRNIVPTPTAVVRTELQKAVGGYREELPHSGDMEMWLRLAAHASVGTLDAYQAVYRRHGANMSLAVSGKRYWGDLLQRREALEHFFSLYASRLGDVATMRRRVNRFLALEATDIASAAFNDQDSELLASASALAVALDPRVTYSQAGLRLGVKRLIGGRLWRFVRPRAP